jgi:Ser/Thr protein kinase RdoA (MazF antagonist)
VSEALFGDERRLSREESRSILEAAADLHRAFADDPPPGSANLRRRIGFTSFETAEVERPGSDLLPKQFEAAWEAFAEAVPQDVAEPVLRSVEDPGPLAGALLAAGPVTLIHGDLRDDNLGFADGRVVMLDWDICAAGTPTVDFAWYLCHDAWRIDACHDELEADFRAAEPALSEREVELGLFSGLVQYGWIFGHSARVHPDPAERVWAEEELAWWVPRGRLALERTGGPD